MGVVVFQKQQCIHNHALGIFRFIACDFRQIPLIFAFPNDIYFECSGTILNVRSQSGRLRRFYAK